MHEKCNNKIYVVLMVEFNNKFKKMLYINMYWRGEIETEIQELFKYIFFNLPDSKIYIKISTY